MKSPDQMGGPEPSSERKFTSIELTQDSELAEKLKRKLEEYRGRQDPYKAPERQFDTAYKVALLERLLEAGHVDLDALAEELHTRYGSLDRDLYANAVSVIESYNRGSLDKLIRGTGLK